MIYIQKGLNNTFSDGAWCVGNKQVVAQLFKANDVVS